MGVRRTIDFADQESGRIHVVGVLGAAAGLGGPIDALDALSIRLRSPAAGQSYLHLSIGATSLQVLRPGSRTASRTPA